MKRHRRVLAGQIAASERHHPDADTTELRRQLKAETLAEHIQKALAGAPPLTDEQRHTIARLLIGGGQVV